jgi:ADP-ribose 1''-phosphate phosphatase
MDGDEMNQIEYRIGNLFDAPEHVLLAHACNAQGVWGSGIAKAFKERFPVEYEDYAETCYLSRHDHITGSYIQAKGSRVVSLITSWGYGPHVSPPQLILENTREAFRQLLRSIGPNEEIHMPMINSGLFRVPWEKTECMLNEVLKDFPHKVVVWKQA